jgi:ribokinase
VDVGEFKQLQGISSGRALVVVNRKAENSIVVVGGANSAFRPEHVAEAASRIAGAAVVVAQLEVPEETVKAAASLATGRFILNPAPASMLQDDLLALVDVLVVNEIEFSTLYGQAVPDSRTHMTSILRDRGLKADVIITLGARGALLWHDGGISSFQPPAVEVVDSTGAGDAFVGALADALARAQPLVEATGWAVCAASISTSALGASTAMPSAEEVQRLVATVSVKHDPSRRARAVKMPDVRRANRGA